MFLNYSLRRFQNPAVPRKGYNLEKSISGEDLVAWPGGRRAQTNTVVLSSFGWRHDYSCHRPKPACLPPVYFTRSRGSVAGADGLGPATIFSTSLLSCESQSPLCWARIGFCTFRFEQQGRKHKPIVLFVRVSHQNPFVTMETRSVASGPQAENKSAHENGLSASKYSPQARNFQEFSSKYEQHIGSTDVVHISHVFPRGCPHASFFSALRYLFFRPPAAKFVDALR